MNDKSKIDKGDDSTAGRVPDRGQLPLDVGLDGEIYADVPVLEDEVDDLIEETPFRSSPTANGGASAPYRLDPFDTAMGAAPGRKPLIVVAILLTVTLLLSAKAIWTGMVLQREVAELNGEVKAMQQRLTRPPGDNNAALAADLDRLAQRVDELGVIVEGPVGHLRESNERLFDALHQRLDRLEAEQKRFAMAPAGTTSINVAETKSTVAAQPLPDTPASTTGKRGWVINLFSLTNAKTADDELARLHKLGIHADKQTVSQEGKNWYRLRVSGFDSYEGAKAYIDTVEKQAGISSAWVGEE